MYENNVVTQISHYTTIYSHPSSAYYPDHGIYDGGEGWACHSCYECDTKSLCRIENYSEKVLQNEMFGNIYTVLTGVHCTVVFYSDSAPVLTPSHQENIVDFWNVHDYYQDYLPLKQITDDLQLFQKKFDVRSNHLEQSSTGLRAITHTHNTVILTFTSPITVVKDSQSWCRSQRRGADEDIEWQIGVMSMNTMCL